MAITEFARTFRVNGTHGSDHDRNGRAYGGRVIADWPGPKPQRFYRGRDLNPTTDLRVVMKGLLADQLGLSPKTLADTVFPDSAPIAPMKRLVS